MKSALKRYAAELEAIREAGTWRDERVSQPASTPPR